LSFFLEANREKILQSLDIWMKPHDRGLGNGGMCTQQFKRYSDAMLNNTIGRKTIQVLQRNVRKLPSSYHVSRAETASSSKHASETRSPRFWNNNGCYIVCDPRIWRHCSSSSPFEVCNVTQRRSMLRSFRRYKHR